jgi:hypothetical protein
MDARPNNSADVTGAGLGSGMAIRKTLKVHVVTPNPALEIVAAYGLGPGPYLDGYLAIKNVSKSVQCHVDLREIDVKDQAGMVVFRTSSALASGATSESYWSKTCILPAEVSYVVIRGITPPMSKADFFAAAAEVQIESIRAECGSLRPRMQVTPTEYAVGRDNLTVTFKNTGEVPVGIPRAKDNFSTYLVLDGQGLPIDDGYLRDQVEAPVVLLPGATGTVRANTIPSFIKGTSNQIRVFLDLDDPDRPTASGGGAPDAGAGPDAR